MKDFAIDMACRAILVPLFLLAVCVGSLLALHDLLTGQRNEFSRDPWFDGRH